jgi:hypothetical protein
MVNVASGIKLGSVDVWPAQPNPGENMVISVAEALTGDVREWPLTYDVREAHVCSSVLYRHHCGLESCGFRDVLCLLAGFVHNTYLVACSFSLMSK